MNVKILTTFFLFVLLLFLSCVNTKIYEGKVQIINRSFDTSLQDSAMIYGYVLSAADENPLSNRTILIKETKNSVFSDSIGLFSMKFLPGTYTIVCFYPPATDSSLELDNFKILPNEKIEIKFLVRFEECF